MSTNTNDNEKILTGVRTVNALLSGLHSQDQESDESHSHSYSDRGFEAIRAPYDDYNTAAARTRYSDAGEIRTTTTFRSGDDLNNARIASYNYGGGSSSITSMGSTGVIVGAVGSNEIVSRVQETILNAKTPIPVNETAMTTVKLNGQDISGIWVNREECLNWRGPIPLEHYKINTETATVMRKLATHTYDQTQNISVKYLKPPPLPAPGDLIIRHDPDVQIPPAPPIIIRQQAVALKAPPTLVYREKPPRLPAPVPSQTISIPGKTIEPPARQVIVERLAAQAPLPQDIVIERWLGFPAQKRNVVHQKAAVQLQAAPTPKNVLIDWEAQDNTAIRQKYHFLGVETADPSEYERRHGHELVETNRLPAFVSELNTKIPNGEQLASNVSQMEFILTGDIDALKLVQATDKNKMLSDYLTYRF
jgi:hypothetical protein